MHGRAHVVVTRAGEPPYARPAIGPRPTSWSPTPPRRRLAVRAADCVPILIADRDTARWRAVHAGWRGTCAGAAGAAVNALRAEFGSRPDDLVAAIGPSIGVCCYEVGPELVDAFAAAGYERHLIDRWFTSTPPPRGSRARNPLRLDVAGANRDQLMLAGVPEEQVHVSGLCTAMHLDVLTSYRAEKEKAGRLVAAIRVGRAEDRPLHPLEAGRERLARGFGELVERERDGLAGEEPGGRERALRQLDARAASPEARDHERRRTARGRRPVAHALRALHRIVRRWLAIERHRQRAALREGRPGKLHRALSRGGVAGEHETIHGRIDLGLAGRGRDGSSRTMLAVTSSAPVDRACARSTVHFVAPADCAANAATSPSTVLLSGTPMPAAPTAPFFKPLSSTAAAAWSCAAAWTVASAVPDVILLSIIAARLGAATAASNRSSDSPPLLARSLWHTAQCVLTKVFCWSSAAGSAALATSPGRRSSANVVRSLDTRRIMRGSAALASPRNGVP